MKAIEGLKPEALWRYFAEISEVPRESKHEGKIREYIKSQAIRLGYRHVVDHAGNVVVYKPGTGKGSPVILQSHLDMVCEKDKGTVHDFSSDPIELVRDGGWIRAEGTTLGADNGIGVAVMLAVMEDMTLTHPDLELLFTIDEETGLTGANLLDTGNLKGRTLVNLDSEEDIVLFIGCAGGKNTDLSHELTLEEAPEGSITASVKVTGLVGGHSGIDIHKGRGNAIKLLTRFLKDAAPEVRYGLASLTGGSKHNAIPREAEAVLAIDGKDLDRLQKLAEEATGTFRQELVGVDDNVRVVVRKEALGPVRVITAEDGALVLNLLHGLPHGVMQMNAAQGGFVVTSTNLAICSMEQGRLSILTNHRSIHKTSIEDISEMTASIARLAGVKTVKSDDYPAWRPDYDSRVLALSRRVYEDLFSAPAVAKVIHAGLECAVFGEKIPGLDMISVGPIIEQAHSPSERVHIGSVGKMWIFVTKLLEEMAE